MKIADLFVSLTSKGSDKLAKDLQGVSSKLSDMKSMSLEAKAGIIAAFYALQQMASSSATAGNSLKQFSISTGMSSETLQRWQYAARQVGVSSQDVESSLKAVQSAMTGMLMGKGAPEGLGMIAKINNGFDMSKAQDTVYVMGELQKALSMKGLDPSFMNKIASSFGVSENMVNALRSNAFNPNVMNKANILSSGEVNQLQQVGVAWSNIGDKIQKVMDHLQAKHGLKLVQDISSIITPLSKLISQLIVLAEKLKVFEMVSVAIKGIGDALKLLSDFVDSSKKIGMLQTLGQGLLKTIGVDSKKDDLKSSGTKIFKNVTDSFKSLSFEDSTAASKNFDTFANKYIAPNVNGQNKNDSSANNFTVNQSITHHGDARDTQGVRDLHRASINQAYRTSGAIAGGQ